MTSEELKQKLATDLSTNGWLMEIAIQLAMLNEKNEQSKTEPVSEMRSETIEAPARVKRAYAKRK